MFELEWKESPIEDINKTRVYFRKYGDLPCQSIFFMEVYFFLDPNNFDHEE